MPQVFPWSFAQLGGPQKTCILQGWQAPFGRARHGHIVNAGVITRRSTTAYPGQNIPKTVHVFGDEPKPFDIHGRWMDFAMGAPGAAAAFRAFWRDFQLDHQIVRASWGNILSYQIFIYDTDFRFESTGDLEWEIHADVLVDENTAKPDVVYLPTKTPLDMATTMRALLNASNPFTATSYNSLRAFLGSVSDLIDTAAAAINAPFAYVYDICSTISDFETAVSSDLGKLGAGLVAMRTGLINLRWSTDLLFSSATYANTPDALAVSDLRGSSFVPANTILEFANDKQSSDAAIDNLLLLIQSMQQAIATVSRGTTSSAYIAQTGDTWEAISFRKFGSADGANAIRDLNGVRYGAPPVPGTRYQIPTHP
ncbi:MAG: hypothetical protein KGO96_14235 [Elusimicrobia bacterium]|nr:hypothetical protein [Elusimicrobiota bacterium]MDE2427053.1 hypothetical protein [Elusimicrobiota bacterium]